MASNPGEEGGEIPPPSSPDIIATLTIVVVALIALGCAWVLPWWAMEARAPQYGQRVLVVQVNPQSVGGDVYEIDSLGHYVGIRPIASVAQLERKLGPVGLALAFLGFLIAPFLRRKRYRLLVVLPSILMPIIFFADLKYWVAKSASDRDPEAALNLTVTDIETKILGKYEVGQFKVSNSIQGGVYVCALAGALGLGLVFCVPIRFPRRRKYLGAVIAFSTMAGASPPPVDAASISIQEMIDRAHEGATVRVPPGIYREHLTISKRIRLIGRPGAIIDGGNTGTLLTVTASGTEVQHLTLRNGGDNYNSEDSAIRIDRAKDVRISDTELLDTLFGIFIVMGDGCRIEGNRIVGKNLPTERRGDGIRLWYSHGCHLLSNRIDRSRDVIIWYSNDTLVERNTVTGSRYGLHYMYADRNRFRHNRFEDNQVGATVMYSRDVVLQENTFSFSKGVAAYGFLLKDADDIVIQDNRFTGNTTGIFFDNSPQARGSRVEVTRNLISQNDVGVVVQPSTHDIEFSENAFVVNRTQVAVAGSGTADNNDWSVNGRGNYWSDALVYDRDHDGVSELPYRIEATFEVLADRYPGLAFFDGTPATQALDMAARLFPIFAPRAKLTDPHPLTRAHLNDGTWRGASVKGSHSVSVAGVGLLLCAGLLAAGYRNVLA